MRIIHGQGYSDDERMKYRELVYKNIVLGVVTLIEAMDKLTIPYEDGDSERAAASLKELDPTATTTISEEQRQAIATLWADPGMKNCYQRRREFQLSDSAK